MDRLTKDKLDLEYFKYIHKRTPKNKKEFECFQFWLDKREEYDLHQYNYGVPGIISACFLLLGKADVTPGNTVMRTRSKNNAMRILYGYV